MSEQLKQQLLDETSRVLKPRVLDSGLLLYLRMASWKPSGPHEKIKVATAAVRLLIEARSNFHYRQLQTY